MDDRRHDRREEVGAVRRLAYGRTRRTRAGCGFFVVLAGAACAPQAAPPPPEPVIVRIGVPEAAVSASDIGLRPVANFLTREGLTSQNHDGRVRPRLAESWTSSEDGLRWRFTIRPGVTFHDGTAATAPLIVESLRSGADDRRAQGLYPGLADIVRVDAPDSRTVEITLRRRSTFLLEDLDFNITKAAGARDRVGTGAFKTVSQSASEIALQAHHGYHQGRSEIDRVNIRAYPTLRTAWASLMRQEIDVLWDLSREALEFASGSDVALYSYLRQYVYVVAFNSGRPAFRSTAVRRALNSAVNRELLIDQVLKGQGIPASGPIWPQHWAYDASLPGYIYDPSLAATTLDIAGRRLVAATDRRRARFTFTCILPQNWVVSERMALNVQKQLYDVGVDMQLQVVSPEKFDRRLRTGDFDAVILELRSGPFLSRPYTFWHWGGEQTAYNVFGYRSTAADRWFEAVRAAPTDAEYRLATGQLQRALLEDPPALFLAWSQRTRAVARRFDVPVEAGRDPIPTFWRWTVNDKATTR